jgi:RsiW-degrading membrane proteinase PrsW (M82 family)
VALAPVVLPVLFWMGYHYYKDRCKSEPVDDLVIAFLLGIGSSFLGLAMYRALDIVSLRYDAFELAETSLPGLFAYAVLFIGMIEEAAKMLPFLLVIIHFKSFDEPIDGIIYASFIAMGFAAVENVQYMRFADPVVAYARGFAGPVVHIVFASIWGYYIGRAWLCRKPMAFTIIASLACTAFLHGVYDFLVIAMPPLALPMAALLVAGIWIWRLYVIRDLHALPVGPCPDDSPD